MADVKASGAKLMMLLLKKSLEEISIDVTDVINVKRRPDYASVSTLSAIGNLSKLLNTDVELIKVKPDSIHFIFGKTFTKKVFVKPRVQINYEASEHVYQKIKTNPQFVVVSSDSLTLTKIDTLYTEKIVLNDLNKSIEQQAEISIPEEINDLVVLSQNKVMLRINLDEYVQKTIQIPVAVTNTPAGMLIKTFPAFVQVSVNAPYNLFDSLNNSFIKATVDFNTPEKGGGKLKVKVSSVNREVKISSCSPEKVEYIIRKK